MGTPNREPQQYNRNIIEHKDPGRYIPVIFLLYSWGALFGVPNKARFLFSRGALACRMVTTRTSRHVCRNPQRWNPALLPKLPLCWEFLIGRPQQRYNNFLDSRVPQSKDHFAQDHYFRVRLDTAMERFLLAVGLHPCFRYLRPGASSRIC